MRKHVVLLVVAVAVTAVVAPAYAEFYNKALAGTAIGVGARAIGMGDAYVAVAQDETALYWNPAGLSANTGFKWHTLSVGGAVDNIDVIDVLADVSDILKMDDTETLSASDFADLVKAARDSSGKPVEIETSLLTSFALGPIALGGYSQIAGTGQFDLDDLVNPTSVAAAADAKGLGAVGVGYGRRLNERLQVGVTVKQAYMYNYAIEKTFSSNGTITASTDISDHDTAITADVGLRYQAEENMAFGLVVRNVTSPTFSLETGTGMESFEVEPSVHFGLAAGNPKNGTTIAADIHNITESNDTGATVHIGVEQFVSRNLCLRAGVRNGQLTFGLGGKLGPIVLEIASASSYEDLFAASFSTDF